MIKKYLYSIFAFILLTVSAHATDTYYCDTGDDSTGAGTKASPWKTFQKATVTLDNGAAGDNVYLCQGGSFTYSTNAIATVCTSANPCSIDDYQPDDIDPADVGVAPDIVIPTNAQHTGVTFDLSAAYITLRDIKFSGDAWDDTYQPWGAYLYRATDHIIIDNVTFDTLGIGVHIYQTVEGYDPQAYPTVKNSRFENLWSQGILGGANNSHVYNNSFNLSGFDVFGHPVYLGGDNVSDYVISGNIITNSAPSDIGNGAYAGTWASGTYGCTSVALVGHGITTNTLIKNNVVREEKETVGGGCWGFAIDTAYPETDEHHVNLIMQNNESYYGGNQQYSCSNCTGVIFRDNIGYSINGGNGIVSASRTEDTPHPTTSMSAFYNLIVHEKVDTGNYQIGVNTRNVGTTTVTGDIQWNVLIFSDDDAFNLCTSSDSGSTVQNNFCFQIDGSGNFTVSTNYVTN